MKPNVHTYVYSYMKSIKANKIRKREVRKLQHKIKVLHVILLHRENFIGIKGTIELNNLFAIVL